MWIEMVVVVVYRLCMCGLSDLFRLAIAGKHRTHIYICAVSALTSYGN